jgi:putative toxin-antitoxin system antitoxin component (TIGR02293 family)
MPKRTKGRKKFHTSAKMRRVHARRVASRALARTGAIGFETLVAHTTPAATKIELIRRGVAARVVDDMVRFFAVPKQVIFGILHTPESTAHRLIKDDRALDSGASERVVRVADIAHAAEETFGSHEAATRWLKAANRGLAGATPLSMVDTEPGAAEVRRLLASINYGGAF